MITKQMRAAVYTQYGPPEVLSIKSLPIPNPYKHEIRIRVLFTTVNRTDCGFRTAEYVISRLFSGLFRPRLQVLGCEFSGIVDAVGENVSKFKPGDAVFGFNDKRFGAYAEYMVLHENDAIVNIPPNISFEQAAALSEGAHYALCNIRAAKLEAGQHVLVYGATGAIGSAAIQLLHAMQINVTAVCRTEHFELLKNKGVDRFIDYTLLDYSAEGIQYDLVFDAVGKSSWGKAKLALKPNGKYISTELGKNSENIWKAILHKFKQGKRLLFPIPTISADDLKYIAQLASSKQFTPLIDRVYDLNEIVEASRYVEQRQKLGNVLLRVGKP